MATFLGIHDMGGPVADDGINSNWEAYKAACAALGITPKHAYSSAQQGKAYCVTEAGSAEQVQTAHDDAKVPVTEILEVKDLQ
jgi:hypothetical protein